MNTNNKEYTEKRCPNCIKIKNNFGVCRDKNCNNYVSEPLVVYKVKYLSDYLNETLNKNHDELLRHYVKTILNIAEAIHRDGVMCGENYQRMSNEINNSKIQ